VGLRRWRVLVGLKIRREGANRRGEGCSCISFADAENAREE